MQKQKRLGVKDMHTDIGLRRKKKKHVYVRQKPVDSEDKDVSEI